MQALGMAIIENPHVVLVPGFWLGAWAWAWDDVVGPLRDAGLAPHAVTLPGLESVVVDRVPERVRRVVYVDSGPLEDGAALSPDLPPDAVEVPLPSWAALEAVGTSAEGLDDGMRAAFRARAVPHPGPPLHTELGDLDVTYVDVPTGHWPMLSRPAELAAAIIAAASS